MERLAPRDLAAGEVVGLHPRIRGDWIGVGGQFAVDGVARGSLHLYRRDGERWAHAQRLVAPAPSADGDAFGAQIAFGDGVLAVGDYAASHDGIAAGAVHTYRLVDGRWIHAQTLRMGSPRDRAGFGAYVEIDGDDLVVAEAEGQMLGGWGDNRAVHLFRRAEGRWQAAGRLVRPDDLSVPQALAEKALAETGMPRHAGFGAHFDLDGDRLLVAAMGAGAVLAYRREAESWRLVQRIDEPEADTGYARTLAVDDGVMVVAALRGNGASRDTGVAHVYREVDGRWQFEQTLALPNGRTLDMFGHWVAIDDGTVLVGAHQRLLAAGLAYAYRRDGASWALAAIFNPPEAWRRRLSAYALDLHGRIVVLSPGDEMTAGTPLAGPEAGGAFVGRIPEPPISGSG